MYYSKLKIFHHKEKLENLAEDKISAPIHIRIKPTNKCNHNCWYCSYQNSYGQLGQDMSKDDIIPFSKMFEIINDCAEMGVEAITFSGGGEPLCHPDIENILIHTAVNRLSIGLLTNGSMLSGSIAETVADHATWIRVSMDGWDNESYKQFRRCGDTDFDKLMADLKSFTAMRKDNALGVNIIVSNKNAGHLYELVRKVYDIGIKVIKVSPCIVSNNSEENNKYHMSLLKTVSEQMALLHRAKIKIYDAYHLQLENFNKDYSWCPNAQIRPVIAADLNVYTCQDKAYNKDTGLLGSIKDKSFRDFWYDGKAKFHKTNPSKDCNHHCIADSVNKMVLEYIDCENPEFV